MHLWGSSAYISTWHFIGAKQDFEMNEQRNERINEFKRVFWGFFGLLFVCLNTSFFL